MPKKSPAKSKEVNSKETGCFWAMMCHLSALAGFIIFPFIGSLALPLLVWAIKKGSSPLVAANGRSVINFILSLWLYTFVFGLGMVILCAMAAPAFFSFYTLLGLDNFDAYYTISGALFLFGMGVVAVLGALFWFFQWALMIYASIKALNGEVYEYPLTIKFLKG